MQIELKRVKGSFIDKSTGVTKECYNYIIVFPDAGYVRVQPTFKQDRRLLNALLPIETLKGE